MGDSRAMQIAEYLLSKEISQDAVKCLAYTLEKLEQAGELEIFISDEIDAAYTRKRH